jgi:hypothetical protein
MTTATSAPDTDHDALLARYRAMAEEASDIIVLHEDGRIVCATGALWRLCPSRWTFARLSRTA